MSDEITYLQAAAILARMKWWQRAIPFYCDLRAWRIEQQIVRPRTAETAERLWRETGLPWEFAREVTPCFIASCCWGKFFIYPADEISVLTGKFGAGYIPHFYDGMDFVDFVVRVEEKFGKEVPKPETWPIARTFAELVTFLHTAWGE